MARPRRLYLYSDHVRIVRVLLLAGTATYLIWWGLVALILPNAFNPLGSRLAVCSLFLATYLASYRWDWIRLHLPKLYYACGWILTFHYFYLFHFNGDNSNWIVGAYITVVAFCACINDTKAFTAYLVYVMLLSVGICALNPLLLKTVFLTGMLTLLTFAYFGMHSRVRLVAKIIAEEQANEKNRALLEISEQALKLRNEFISIASHELKTPLTTILIQTQLARRNFKKNTPDVFSPERTTKTIGLIERQATRLKDLIEAMLDISRITLGKVEMKFARCNLSPLVNDVVLSLDETLKESGCAVELNLLDDVTVQADAMRLEQVVVNLLTNAMKYAKGKPVRIFVDTDDKDAILVVEDEGVGIAPANLDRIFDKFERAGSTKNVSGFGLGLFVSRYIVEAHKGTIRVESELGQGSRFIVRLPQSRQ